MVGSRGRFWIVSALGTRGGYGGGRRFLKKNDYKVINLSLAEPRAGERQMKKGKKEKRKKSDENGERVKRVGRCTGQRGRRKWG